MSDDEHISKEAREVARGIMKALGVDHPKGEVLIGEVLEEWANAAYTQGQKAKFDEIMRGFVGAHIMLLTSEGRSHEEAIEFMETYLTKLRRIPGALGTLQAGLDQIADKAKDIAHVEEAVANARPSKPPKDAAS